MPSAASSVSEPVDTVCTVAHAHDGALAELPLNLLQRRCQSLFSVVVHGPLRNAVLFDLFAV
jgi:hypothetical protein